MITRNFNLNLYAGHSSPLVINANQYDQGEQWVFTLYNEDGTQYVPSTGAIVGIKSDGLGIINTGSVVDGKVVINETQQMTAAVGKATFELMLDSQTHGTANFVVLVEPKPGDNASLSESDLSLIQEALNATSPLPTGGTVGQVLTKTANGSAWSDAGTPTQEQVAEAVSDWADENITVTTGVVIDQSLSVSGAAADSKKVGDELNDLKSQISDIEEQIEGGTGSGLTSAIKSALMQLAQKVAYIDDDGQQYYNDLYDALYPPIVVTNITLNTNSLSFVTLNSTQQLTATTTPTGGEVTWSSSNTSVATVSATGLVTAIGYGSATITATSGSVSATCSVVIAQATVTSISAVYTQSGTVYDTDSLDSLKSDLVVTATWSNQTTSTVASADYTLSGTLSAGTSTITVSYGGETTTFTVTVTSEYPTNYTWLYKASDGQTLTQRSDLVTKTITNGTINEELVDGLLHITAPEGINGCKWDFVQATQASAVLTIKFKIMDCPLANSICGFQPQVSNGTGGAKFGTARYESYLGAINAQTFVGTAVQWEGELTTDTWHILELDLANGKQTVTLDGTAIATDETTANQYCVNNRIFVQSNNAHPGAPTEVYIDWISYWNRSA